MIERSGEMALATTVSLAVLRGPVPLAKALAAIDLLSEGRLVAAVGPGSSERDYRILGIPFSERWKRFDEALTLLRALLEGEPMPEQPRYYPVTPDIELAPHPWRQDGVPLWIGSWGSPAGPLGSRDSVTAGSPRPTTPRRRAFRGPDSFGGCARGARA